MEVAESGGSRGIGSRFLLWFGLLLSQLYWFKVLALVWIAVVAVALVQGSCSGLDCCCRRRIGFGTDWRSLKLEFAEIGGRRRIGHRNWIEFVGDCRRSGIWISHLKFSLVRGLFCFSHRKGIVAERAFFFSPRPLQRISYCRRHLRPPLLFDSNPNPKGKVSTLHSQASSLSTFGVVACPL